MHFGDIPGPTIASGCSGECRTNMAFSPTAVLSGKNGPGLKSWSDCLDRYHI